MIYNKLVTLRNRFKNAYAQIDVQLKRRYDLIPNLVETAKGYMKHESGTLEAVTAARNIKLCRVQDRRCRQSRGFQRRERVGCRGSRTARFEPPDDALEAYPDLKANQNMMQRLRN